MPIGTSWNVPSGAIIGFVFSKTRLNVCSMLELMQLIVQWMSHIWLKRARTRPMIVLAFPAPCPSCTMSKKPPISGLASDCMNCASLFL